MGMSFFGSWGVSQIIFSHASLIAYYFLNAARNSISPSLFLHEAAYTLQPWICCSWLSNSVVCGINPFYS